MLPVETLQAEFVAERDAKVHASASPPTSLSLGCLRFVKGVGAFRRVQLKRKTDDTNMDMDVDFDAKKTVAVETYTSITPAPKLFKSISPVPPLYRLSYSTSHTIPPPYTPHTLPLALHQRLYPSVEQKLTTLLRSLRTSVKNLVVRTQT